MSDLSDRNVFMLLIRLNLSDPNPLVPPTTTTGLPKMEESKSYALVAGLLDASQQTTRTPLTTISFNEERKEIYNGILSKLKDVIESFYHSKRGFLACPEEFSSEEQAATTRRISEIGRDIFDLIPRRTALCGWLDGVFQGDRSALEHITIITNDFNIPWYWMKNAAASSMLCEICALGMLQLIGRGVIEPDDDEISDSIERKYLHALLIKGSSGEDLPFSESQMESLQEFLKTGKDLPGAKERLRPFNVDLAREYSDIRGLLVDHGKVEARSLYRLVHYSGHWNQEEEKLWVGSRPVNVGELREFVESAVLALDGCSSSRGLQAWSGIETLTGKMLSLGALACMVTTLPIKDDPIVAQRFWEAFYGSFLRQKGPMSLGQALRKARGVLKDHLRASGSKNPAWAFYQLIGNPTIRLVGEDASVDG